MKSILENRPELAYEVNQAAEVAGYLRQEHRTKHYSQGHRR